MSRRGERLRACAAAVFDAGTMERVIDPAIADLQREPPSIAAHVAVLKVLLLCGYQEATMSQHQWTSEDRRALTRALTGGAIVTLLVTLGLEAPFLSYAWHPGSIDRRLPLYLAPQGLPIAIAIGVTLGTLFGFAGRQVSGRVSVWLLALALAASMFSFVDLGWITPAGNQAFRVAISGNSGIARGAPELTLGELWQFASPDYAFNFHTRIALAFAPLVLAIFALSIVRMKPAGGWIAGLTAVVAFVGYYMLLYGGRSMALDGTLPAFAGAWIPNVAVGLVAGLFAFVSRRSPAPRRQVAS